jgi:hypothetical protein
MGERLVTIAVAITGVATLALLVSKRANTAQVIGAAGKAFSQSLGVALSPVTGSSNNLSGFQSSF